jgi:hypothetical protein
MASPKSGTAASKKNGTASSGKVRHVASQGGVKRYHKPIGAEIGGPRDAQSAAIQKDQGARKNYSDLINGDPKSQREALGKMSEEDLNKLADIAFSFKSGNSQVVALRIAARNEQARRGNKIAPGVTQSSGGSKPTPYDRGAQSKINYALSGGEIGPQTQRVVELVAAATKLKNTTTGLGNFPIPDVNHLRKAIQAIGRAKPADRPAVARHIIARARALKATHLISPAIKAHAMGKAAGGSGKQANPFGKKELTAVQRQALELAGHWKHGYIPLDAAARASKMKGGKGKPWWNESAGTGGSSRPQGSPKSGGGLTNVVKSGGTKSPSRGAAVNSNETAKQQIANGQERAKLPTLEAKKNYDHARHNGASHAEAMKAGRSSSYDRTKGKNPIDTKRTSAVRTEAARARNNRNTPESKVHQNYLAAPKGSPEKAAHSDTLKGKFDARAKKDIANSKARLAKLGIDAHGNKVGGQQKADMLAAARKQAAEPRRRPASVEPNYGAKLNTSDNRVGRNHTFSVPELPPKKSAERRSTDRTPGTSKKVSSSDSARSKRIAESNMSPAAKQRALNSLTGNSNSPATLAKNYVEMHGRSAAVRRIEQLQTKKLPTARDKALLAALKAEVGPGKA